MKAQSTVEFVVAGVFFIVIIAYVILYINGTFNFYSSEYMRSELETQAAQISELVLHSEGQWTSGVPDTPGLADPQGWPVLNRTKIDDLETYCSNPSNFESLKQKLGLTERHFLKITIADIEPVPTVLVDCGTVPQNIPATEIKRIAVDDSPTHEYLNISFWLGYN